MLFPILVLKKEINTLLEDRNRIYDIIDNIFDGEMDADNKKAINSIDKKLKDLSDAISVLEQVSNIDE